MLSTVKIPVRQNPTNPTERTHLLSVDTDQHGHQPSLIRLRSVSGIRRCGFLTENRRQLFCSNCVDLSDVLCFFMQSTTK